jgi:hypothetical protein
MWKPQIDADGKCDFSDERVCAGHWIAHPGFSAYLLDAGRMDLHTPDSLFIEPRNSLLQHKADESPLIVKASKS